MGKTKRKADPEDQFGIGLFLIPLQSLNNLSSDYDQQGVIIGGIASGLLGKPRLTFDIDAVFLLSQEDIPKFLEAASRYELQPRIPDAEAFARKHRILLLTHVPSDTDVDISLGILPFEVEMVERSQVIDLGTIRLRIPTPEDLIILKAVAHRPKDLEDIRGIASNHPELDKARIRDWVQQFGAALDFPDLWLMIEKLL